MSGLKPQAMTEFYRAMHARGVTTETLAAQLGVSGGAVRRILSGHRRSSVLRKRLETLLTERERTLFAGVEQSSTWNTKRPRWTAEKAAALSTAA